MYVLYVKCLETMKVVICRYTNKIQLNRIHCLIDLVENCLRVHVFFIRARGTHLP